MQSLLATLNGLQGMNTTMDPATSITENSHAYPKTFCRVYQTLQRGLGEKNLVNCTAQYSKPAAPCVCPVGLHYDGKRPITWVPGRTCDDALGLILAEILRSTTSHVTCQEAIPWLMQHRVLESTRKSCCISASVASVDLEAYVQEQHQEARNAIHRYSRFHRQLRM